MRQLFLVATLALIVSPLGASATSLGLITLPEGNTIIQVTDALAGSTNGGIAVAETRTAYYFAPDFGDPAPNTHDYGVPTPDVNWPYVYTDGSLMVDAGISALVTTENDGVGDFITIDGNPIYQWVFDLGPMDATGNFGPWFFIEPDGTATQAVPEPGTAMLFGLGLTAMAMRRR